MFDTSARNVQLVDLLDTLSVCVMCDVLDLRRWAVVKLEHLITLLYESNYLQTDFDPPEEGKNGAGMVFITNVFFLIKASQVKLLPIFSPFCKLSFLLYSHFVSPPPLPFSPFWHPVPYFVITPYLPVSSLFLSVSVTFLCSFRVSDKAIFMQPLKSC